MKKIFEMALNNALITKEGINDLIDYLNNVNQQENAILIITGNFIVPADCAIGTKGFVGWKDKYVGEVVTINKLNRTVGVKYYDESRNNHFTRIENFDDWVENVNEYRKYCETEQS